MNGRESGNEKKETLRLKLSYFLYLAPGGLFNFKGLFFFWGGLNRGRGLIKFLKL